jgi:NAD(P)-dependent dehydrogenase (short-subunit alcohol dehydrogenase family)
MPRVFADPPGERAARVAAILALDGACSVAALFVAIVLRFEEGVPGPHPDLLPVTFAVLVAARLAVNAAARLHRWPFRLAGEEEAVRLAAAALGGSALFLAVSETLVPPGLPRTVYALEFFLSSTAFTALRFGPRVMLRAWAELRRRRSDAVPTLVVGVSFGAELLARDIARAARSPWYVAGFVATDPSEVGRRIEGKPVLGTVEDLEALVARHRIRAVLLAVARPTTAALRAAVAACASRGVRFKILPACASLAEPVSAAMLDDLAPEDLLPLPQAGPGHGELRRRVAGRRALVTGAAAAIGGEICRQLAHHGVRQVVMVDADEAELYRRARRLAAEQPEVDVRAEVADLRAPEAVARIAERCRPDVVFHAPPGGPGSPRDGDGGDALRTRNAARLAGACGARRLVLVSLEERGGRTPAAAATDAGGLALPPRTEVRTVRLGTVLASPPAAALRSGDAAARADLAGVRPGSARPVTVPEAARAVLVAGLDEPRERGEGPGAALDLARLARLALARSRRDGAGPEARAL